MRKGGMILGAIFGTIGSALLLWGVTVDSAQAAYSYLVGYVYIFTLVVGTLFILMIGHACNAKWFVPLRRPAEVVVGAFPLLCVLWLPLFFWLEHLYPWLTPAELPLLIQHHVIEKLTWLDRWFFVGRSVTYLALFVLFAELLRYWSLRQDADKELDACIVLHKKMVNTSVGGLVVLSFTVTFLAWDWIMSLEPAWYSSLFGVYVFAGGFLAALGLWGAMSVIARRKGLLPERVAEQHWHAIGRLQLGMVIFWTYIGWAHVLQHWIANVPAEQLWYLRRWVGGWEWFGLLLIVAHWGLPFFALLSRPLKKNPNTFLAISAYLVLVHLLDVYYLIMPALHEGELSLSWMTLAAVAAVAGWSTAFTSLRTTGMPAVSTYDPLFEEGLSYQSQS